MGVSPIAPGNSQVKTASNEDGVIRRVTALSPATWEGCGAETRVLPTALGINALTGESAMPTCAPVIAIRA